jgi:peptide/nickel transport system substrate-binding protein
VRHGFGSRKRGGAAVIALALVLAMVLAACGSSGSTAKEPSGSTGDNGSSDWTADLADGPIPGLKTESTKPTAGGDMTFALDAESTGGWCLPEAQLAIAGIQVARSIYDYLTVPDDKGGYVPFLADKVTPADNYKKWTIHLRSGIKFQDGSDLNAQVVKNNLDAYRGQYPARSPLLFVFVFDYITDVKVVDDLTVEVDMKKPWASFPAHLYEYGRLGIMAQKQLDDGKNCFEDMIGTGPFKLQDWVTNDHLTVVKNDNYWRKDSFGQQLPYLDKITFKPVPDGAQQLNGFKSKAFDLGNTDDTTTVIPGLLPDVKAGSMDLAVAKQNPEVGYTIFNTSKEPFNNMNARKAWVYAFDTTTYNRARNSDLNQVANGPFGPGVIGYLDDTGFPKYNLDQAKAAVAAYKTDTGKDLNFTLSIPNDSASRQSAEVTVGFMQKAGMKVSLKPEEQSQEINDVIAGSYQAAAWRNHPGFDPDTQWVWWHCDAAPAAVAPTDADGNPAGPAPKNVGVTTSAGPVGNNCNNLVNFSKFNDPVINKAFETGRGSTDDAVRQKAYEDINKEFAKQVWEAWSFWSVWTVPYQTDVRGVLGPKLPTETSPDAVGSEPYLGLSSGTDVSALWLKQG